MKVPTTCKECGGAALTWQTTNQVHLGCSVQNGRLVTSDVECLFFLGCDDCSETLLTLNADDITRSLNAAQEQPHDE